jgi:pyruvate/2-oxoglutarate/acetoin dehydrogenase E1 component
LDLQTIIDSVKKTGRIIIVEDDPISYGWGAEIAAGIAGSEAFDYLDAPIKRLAGLDIPIPYNPNLEKHAVPQVPNNTGRKRNTEIKEDVHGYNSKNAQAWYYHV